MFNGIKKHILVMIIFWLSVGFIALFIIFNLAIARTPKNNSDKSIAELEKINIGGINQWVLIRGDEIDNPVILFLHGGPGTAEMPLVAKYNKNLEKEFIVVNWDQRGAGKSYSSQISLETMNTEQFISDANELVAYLKERFNKKKIFLVGHSWGSFIGTNLANRFPEDYYAYIGTGQFVNGLLNEEYSYEYTLEMARSDVNKKRGGKALEELTTRAKFKDGSYVNGIDGVKIQRKWLKTYNGFRYAKSHINDLLLQMVLAPEYNLVDLIHFVKGSSFSSSAMWGWIEDVDFLHQITEFEVPIFFLQGRYDYNTPTKLVEEYYNIIESPNKELVYFEESAHMANFEEAEKFNAEVIRIKQLVY
jgi:pimeloyl-ACP methyl ester carboxylesterase